MGDLFLPNVKGDDITRYNGSYAMYYRNYDCMLQDQYRMNNYYSDYVDESVNLWENLYQVILTVNNTLSQFPEPILLEENYRQILGELYFLRAYCHFRLTRCFGKIPVVTDIEVDYQKPLLSWDEQYGLMARDLKTAQQLLPQKASEARIPFETPHQGSALTLLAELYLNWAGFPAKNAAMYHEAARVAGKLIDSARFYELGLLPDFRDVWKKEPHGNTEIAFSLSFANPELSTEFSDVNQLYYARASYWPSDFMVSPTSLSLYSFFFGCEINFYNFYPASYRKDATFYTSIYVPGSFEEYGVDTGYVYIDEWNTCYRPAYQKFFIDSTFISEDHFNSYWLRESLLMGNQRLYLLRYAHTLLTYAEAKARAGELDASAYEAVNMIRRRAHHVDLYSPSPYDMSPGLAPDVFADSVVWERAWELAGEPEGRWFDLLRLEKVLSIPNLRHRWEGDIPKEFISQDDFFFPIPERDQVLNPNLQ